MFNNKVVVYGKPECPYCVKATGILDAKGVKYTYVDVSVDLEAKAFLDAKGHATVPQIYVNDNYHGESESAKTVSNSEGGIRVVKRDGSLEPLDINKIHKVIDWAAEGLDVSVSQVEIDSRLQFYDCIPTENIQKTIIKAAADLISVDYPDYQYLAARLVVFNLRKKVYGSFEPPALLDHVIDKTSKGLYDEHILRDYSEKEFEELDKYIKHDNDMKFAYAGIMQMEGKYLVQNRVTKEVYETPQFLYMLIGMCLFNKYEGKRRLQLVKEFYDETSKFKLSLPTPIMSGVRTPTRQFSSCFTANQKVRVQHKGMIPISKIEVGDYVLTSIGEFKEVEATRAIVSDSKLLYSMRHGFGIPWELEATEEHEFLIRGVNTKPEWKKIRDITPLTDYIRVPYIKETIHLDTFTLDIPEGYTVHNGFICKMTTDKRVRSGRFDDKVIPIRAVINLDEDFGFMLGQFYAQGCVFKDHYVTTWTLPSSDTTNVDRLKNIISKVFGYEPSIEVRKDNSTAIKVFSRVVAEFFTQNAGIGYGTKYVKDFISTLNTDIQLSILRGVFYGDGCIHKQGASLALTNETLIYQLAEMCIRCKLHPSLGSSSDKLNKFTKNGIVSYHESKGQHMISLSFGFDHDFITSIGKGVIPIRKDSTRCNSFFDEEDNYWSKVFQTNSYEYTGELVYDIAVKDVHDFFVSGVCGHNCVLIETGDDLDSINATTSAIVKYVSQRAGIGVNGGRIRALGSEIRGGESKHTGIIPFWKMFQSAVKSCSAGGVRGGAATMFYPFWHLELESLLVLKNNKGIEENRIRHLDYGVQLNKLMYERFITDDYISLFSPNDVEGMYDAFFQDQDLFRKLYTEAEANPLIRRKRVKAVDVFGLLAMERASTGRIYIQNVDHCNTNSPFDANVAPIRQSNLCVEIALPTKPLSNVLDEDGEVALCTLAALNLGVLKTHADIEKTTEIAVRALDALLDYQNYPLPAALRSSMGRRTLGIGVINYANWLAKQGFKYSDSSGNNKTHELFEAIQYYCLKASNNLAKELGACPYFHETTYAAGILPIDRYKKDVDALHSAELLLNWEELRASILQYGLRNSTLTAIAPTETSAQVSNATNGIEPPRGYVSVKSSKDGVLRQVVPELKKLKNYYELLWDIPDNKGYLDKVGIMQKFIDQSISANTNYDPSKFEDGKVPLQVIIHDLLYAYKVGAKTLYYHNTRDGSSTSQDEVVEVEDESCASGACKI